MDLPKLFRRVFTAIRLTWGYSKFAVFENYLLWQWRGALKYLSRAEYAEVPPDNLEKSLQRVIACYQKALRVCTEQESPLNYIMIQNRLGVAYSKLPAGDRTENLQKAITCYHNALRNCTRQEFTRQKLQAVFLGDIYIDVPNKYRNVVSYFTDIKWEKRRDLFHRFGFDNYSSNLSLNFPLEYEYSIAQYNLGNAYAELPTGDRTENLQRAITYYQNALRFYTEHELESSIHLMEYARLQSKLGDAYADLPTGERAENLQQAITWYYNAIRIYNEQEFPLPLEHSRTYAATQTRLGDVFTILPTGNRADNLQKAIICYYNTLHIYNEKKFPMGCATIQTKLGDAYTELLIGDQVENVQSAIRCYKNALRIYTEQEFPQQHAKTQNSLSMAQKKLGDAYANLTTGDQTDNSRWAILYYKDDIITYIEQTEDKAQAITCCHNLLRIFTEQDFPEDYAWAQNYLGDTYRELPTGDRATNLQQAITCYENALRIYTEQDFPKDYAWAQSCLGDAYRELPTRDRAKNLQQAITCYENALRIYTEQDFPKQYAWAQNYLGDVYRDLPIGDQAQNLQQAIACYKNALRIYTEQDFPKDYAYTQSFLGFAYRRAYKDLSSEDRTENLQRAITCYENALRIHTEQDFPENYAEVQSRLGDAYRELPTEDRAKNLQRAITCYENALRIYTEQDFPKDYAWKQKKLGDAYRELPTGDRAKNLQRAITCYENALRIYTEQNFPKDYAEAQSRLADAYRDLPIGDRTKNLQQAITCYKNAIRIYTEQTENQAENLRQAINCCNNMLRICTEQDFPKDYAWVQDKLRFARANLPNDDQPENLLTG